MANQTTDELQRATYRQRQKVMQLRQRLYTGGIRDARAGLLEALLAAEAELDRLESAMGEPTLQQPGGVLLDSAGEATKPGGVLMGPETTGVDVKVLLRQSHVPTGIVHLLDDQETPLVTFRVKYAGDEPVRLRFTSFVEAYSAQAVDTVELFYGDEVEIHHLPTFFPQRLRAVTEMTRATLHIRIDDLDGATEQHSTFPLWLLARTSAYLGVRDPATRAWLDFAPYLAAWVTPNRSEIMALLRRAAEMHPERHIVGYQVDAAGVEAQVRAAFEALKAEELVYINSVLAFGVTEGAYMQRVRLPQEALKQRSANCIDGTLLMASLLEAASLNPGIVLVPGHAFLAWETQDGSGAWDYLETTMIGSADFQAALASARELAGRQRDLAERTGSSRYFRLLSIPDLRVRRGITPME
jgi:hypothetical protein